jgi:hypothetical protein
MYGAVDANGYKTLSIQLTRIDYASLLYSFANKKPTDGTVGRII